MRLSWELPDVIALPYGLLLDLPHLHTFRSNACSSSDETWNRVDKPGTTDSFSMLGHK